MAKSLNQDKIFNLAPNKLYQFYMDDKMHSEITGQKAKIGEKTGDAFSAFSGDIKGKILHTLKNKMVVQTWRYKNWDKTAMDSIVTITFNGNEDGSTKVSLSQVNIPEDQLDAVKKGWVESYWNTWKKYITKPPVKTVKTAKAVKKGKKATTTAKVAKTTKTKRPKKVTPKVTPPENITIS